MDIRSADRRRLMKPSCVPLEDASVDLLVVDYVIEHVQTAEAFTAEISRLLKPEGWFALGRPISGTILRWERG